MSKSKVKEQLTRMRCSVCKRINYFARKNRKKVERKLEYKKYCSWCRKSTVHKEAKK